MPARTEALPDPKLSPLGAPQDGGRPDTRTRLLNAAVELVEQQGLQALTQARVAAAAGLRQSHLTYHFPTRSHLLTAVALHCATSTMTLMGAQCAAVEDLAAFRRRLAERVVSTPLPRLMLALTLASEEDTSLKTWLADFGARAVEHLHSRFTALGVPVTRDAVALFHASLVGVCTMQVGAGASGHARSQALVEAAFDRLVAGAEAGAGAGAGARGGPGAAIRARAETAAGAEAGEVSRAP